MTIQPHVSIIIPNWNGYRYLRDCLDSIRSQSYSNFEVILVDNGSSDDSIKLIGKKYPWVRAIELDNNFGFARAVNIGIKASKGDVIALLNNDVVVHPLWLEEGIKGFREGGSYGSDGFDGSDSWDSFNGRGCTTRIRISRAVNGQPQPTNDRRNEQRNRITNNQISVGSIVMCACKILDFERRNILKGAGDELLRDGRPYPRGLGKNDGERFNLYCYVFGASGAAAFYRRSLFDDVGYFDEDFFAYLEDADLNLRVRKKGWRCRYIPTSIVYHRGGGSEISEGRKVYLVARNKIYLWAKNLPLKTLMRNSPYMCLGLVRSFIYHLIISREIKGFLTGTWAGIKGIPKFFKKRQNGIVMIVGIVVMVGMV